MGRVLRLKQRGGKASFVLLVAENTTEDPAFRAHRGFIDQVLPSADALRSFRPGEESAVLRFLRGDSTQGDAVDLSRDDAATSDRQTARLRRQELADERFAELVATWESLTKRAMSQEARKRLAEALRFVLPRLASVEEGREFLRENYEYLEARVGGV